MTRACVLGVVTAVQAASCAMIGSTDHFEPDRSAARPESVSVKDSGVSVVPAALVVGGEAKAYAIDLGLGRLTVSSPDFSWDQEFVGPVVPVLPVFMSASTYEPQIELHVTVNEADSPIALVPASIGLVPRGSTVPIVPSACGHLPTSDDEADVAELPAGEPVELSRGDGIWLRYPCENVQTESFDLLLPAAAAPCGAPADFALRFERSHSRFLAFYLPLPFG